MVFVGSTEMVRSRKLTDGGRGVGADLHSRSYWLLVETVFKVLPGGGIGGRVRMMLPDGKDIIDVTFVVESDGSGKFGEKSCLMKKQSTR